MGPLRLLACGLAGALAASAQSSDDLTVYTEHPRLLLRPARLRLLKRERERRSLRWAQFETLMAGGVAMPEPGFARALYYRVTEDREAARAAIAWALEPASDLRQTALVFDWCQDLLSEAQSRALAERLERGLARARGLAGAPAARSRLLAAVALAGHRPEVASAEIGRLVRDWWEGRIVPALRAGRPVLSQDDMYAAYEFLHAMRDNLNLDLRDSAPRFFADAAMARLLYYYPATYPAGENDFRIPAAPGEDEPDLQRAALWRAAELAMVAFDTNAPSSQVLQGWLMHDRFLLRGPFGIPYELLWANPYQPGLSYYHVPLLYHDAKTGTLLVRSSWEESARWLGYIEGRLQLFDQGEAQTLDPRVTTGPLSLDEAVLFFARDAGRLRVTVKEDEQVLLLGLKPNRKHDVEVDGEEIREAASDAGGMLFLDVPRHREVGVRVRESRQ